MHLPTPQIRPAHPEDADALPDIERSAAQLFTQAPGLQWLADAPVASPPSYQRLIQQGTVWVAAHSDGRLQGFLSAERCGPELHLWELSVHADWQRQGLGRLLLQRAAEQAAAWGLNALTLTTFADLPWNAPAYARQGFVPAQPPGPRLQAVLDAEAAHGLPAARRIAMRRGL